MARDSRAEAIRAWRKLRPHVQAWSLPKIMEQLESLARREYEAGYRDGNAGDPCFFCCECADEDACYHTAVKCWKCIGKLERNARVEVKAQARRRG